MHPKRRRDPALNPRQTRGARRRDRWWLALLAVFAVAMLWRVLFLRRLFSGPLSGHFQGDESIYWDWSTSLIESGFHASNPFFLGPLYPYFLALLRLAAGDGLPRAVMAQSLLGGLTAVMITDAARRIARPGIALFIGLVVALYEMLVLFDALILMESLLLALGALLLWLVARIAGGATRPAMFAAVGGVIGLAAECRASSALLLIPALWFVLESGDPDRARKLRRAGLTAVTFLAVSLPSMLWNAVSAHAFIPYTYSLGYNLYVGNNPQANGAYVPIADQPTESAVAAGRVDGGVQADGREFLHKRLGLVLSASASSSYWRAQATSFVRRHPGRTLQLIAQKALLLVNRTEVTQIESAEMYRRLAGPLGLPLVGTFLFVGPLGLAGALYAGRAGSYGRFLRRCLVVSICGILPFFVTDRYRVHLVPALALLSALALECGWTWWRDGAWGELRRASLVLAAALALVMLPVRGDAARLEEWTNWQNIGVRWAEHGESERAIEAFDRASTLARAAGFDRNPAPAIAEARALGEFNRGVALHQLGRDGEALRWLEAAVRDDATNAQYVRTLADAYRAAGLPRAADSLARSLGGLVGGEPQALIQQGWQAMREARPADAESLFTLATRVDENQFGAWMALVRVQVERQELAAASRTLERAARLRVPEDMLWAHRALVAAASGDSAAALGALGRIPPASVAGNRLLEGVIADARRRLARPR